MLKPLPAQQRHLFFAIFILLVVLLAFTPIRTLVMLCLDRSNSDLSHTILIPFISAAFIYWERSKIFRDLRTSFLPAAVACVVGGLFYYLGVTHQVQWSRNDYLSAMIAAV